MDLTISPPKWPPKEMHCRLSAEFMTHWVSFPQPHWMQSCEKDWDDTFSQSHQLEWNKIYESLTPLSSLPLPRYIGDEHKLLCFTDASAKAYSAAVYLYSSVNRKTTVILVFAKACVAPAKLSIPSLELLGVLIGMRCFNYVIQQLQLSLVGRFLWTDSQCVLQWMTTSKPWPVFVQNRLREITSHRDIKFDYVFTSQNPADLATRGVPADELIYNNLWWHGPSWLTDHPSQWLFRKSTQFDRKMSQQNTKQFPGPHVMYETTTLAGIPRESIRISLDRPVVPKEITPR